MSNKITVNLTSQPKLDVNLENVRYIGGDAKPEQEKKVTINENGNYQLTPDHGKTLALVDLIVATPEPKQEQEKAVTITENGAFEVLPDAGRVLSKVTANVDVSNPLEYACMLDRVFTSVTFPANYNLVLNVPNIESIRYPFSSSHISGNSTLKVISSGDAPVNMQSFIDIGNWYNNFKTVDLTDFHRPISNAVGAFHTRGVTERILGEIDLSAVDSATNQQRIFNECTALKTVSLKPNSCKWSLGFRDYTPLDKQSILSVVAGMSDTVTGQTLTLPKQAVDNTFTGGSTGAEWLALLATKPNWTITLA